MLREHDGVREAQHDQSRGTHVLRNFETNVWNDERRERDKEFPIKNDIYQLISNHTKVDLQRRVLDALEMRHVLRVLQLNEVFVANIKYKVRDHSPNPREEQLWRLLDCIPWLPKGGSGLYATTKSVRIERTWNGPSFSMKLRMYTRLWLTAHTSCASRRWKYQARGVRFVGCCGSRWVSFSNWGAVEKMGAP